MLNAGPAQPLVALLTPYDSSLYTTATRTVTVDVLRAATTTTIAATPSNVSPLQQVTVNATITALSPGGVVTGSVRVLDGATVIGTAAIVNNNATFVVSGLSSGVHSLSAVYVADLNHIGSAPADHRYSQRIAGTHVHVRHTHESGAPRGVLDRESLRHTLTGSPVRMAVLLCSTDSRIREHSVRRCHRRTGKYAITYANSHNAILGDSTPPTTDQCRSSQAVQDGAPNSVRRQDAHTERVVTNRDSGAGSLWTVHYCYGDVESCDFKSGGGGGAVSLLMIAET